MSTSSPVTERTTSGPVTKTRPSGAHDHDVGERRAVGGTARGGPSTTEICGTWPEARTIAANTWPTPSSASTPSASRAPPECQIPMTGTPSDSGEVDGLDDAPAALGAHRAAHPGGVGAERDRRAAVDETTGGDHAVGVTRGQPHEGGGVEERVQADARIYHVTGSSCTPYTNMSYLNGTFSTGTASRRDGIRRNSVSQTTCSCTLASSWPMHW